MSRPLKTLVVGVVAVLSLWGLAACSDDEPADPAASQEAGEPDLSGIPDVVAVVNDREIGKDAFVTAYRTQFEQSSMQAQAGGEPVDQDELKEQTADGLVSNELLLEEAERRDFTATEKDVDETLAEFVEQSGIGTTEEYLAALEEQGLDEDEVRAQLGTQVKLDQLLAEEVGDDEASEKELRALYDQAVAQQEQAGAEAGQEIPPFEEVRPQLEEQAQSTKESEAAQALLAELREDAEITINL